MNSRISGLTDWALSSDNTGRTSLSNHALQDTVKRCLQHRAAAPRPIVVTPDCTKARCFHCIGSARRKACAKRSSPSRSAR